MESDLLFDRFEGNKTSQETQEHIRAMGCGKTTFQAETLGFVFRKLITRKRHAIPESAMLRCARALGIHVYTLSELYEGLYCPECGEGGRNGKGRIGRPFTRCGFCSALRDTEVPRCTRCNVTFKPY